MSRVKAWNLTDFTGGLNLRRDAFELTKGESPDMLNVDIDEDGGFVARKGWTRQNTTDIDTPWDPRNMFVHELADGTDNVYLANGTLWYSTNDAVTWAEQAAISASAEVHGMDFAPWGDTLYACRGSAGTLSGLSLDDACAPTTIVQAETATWSPYSTPVTCFPFCSYIASHAGYMFAAKTEENGGEYPHRVRWSHPNVPEAWLEDDYIDIKEGGGPITGLVPMRDHLLIFKQSAVWALYGYDSDSWQLVNVSRELGAPHRNAIARSEAAVFFYSQPRGVFALQEGQYPKEISRKLRTALQSSDFITSLTDDIFMGWLDGKLLVSAPYNGSTTATDAETVFQFMPAVGQGAWSAHRAATGEGLGPFAQGGFGGGEQKSLACGRVSKSVVKLNDNALPTDDMDGTEADFSAYYVTKWVNAEWPTLKKRWRRPDIIAKERSAQWDLTITAFHEYDEATEARSKTIPVDAGSSGSLWGAFTYGDGTIYGSGAKGSRIERSGSLGSTPAVQLRIAGEAGLAWGVDAIVFKYTPRRLR